ncbi:MAG: glutamate-5-semialdehyde dehydrogenase [Janthinobacterium lividum]
MSTPAIQEVEDKGRAAKTAARTLGTTGTSAKNAVLEAMAEALGTHCDAIKDANSRDLANARDKGMTPHLVERLTLSTKRIGEMQTGLSQVAALPDPIGTVLSGWRRPNGLQITKTRVPLGVIGIIYESRPNVTVDAAALCLKSGNAALLRGGSEAIHSNIALADVLQNALETAGLPRTSIQLIQSTDRAAARRLMTLNGYVDCLIPRGGAELIKTVVENATVPVIETGTGNCHIYVDKDADFEMALEITLNAKVQRPSVCNSAETLLIHEKIAADFLPLIGRKLIEAGVEIRADTRTAAFLPNAVEATEEDWYTEYNALILAVKIVDSLEDAVSHINKYGTQHSEAIITENYAAAQTFTTSVDCAAAYVNASTRFTDGFEFGFGAEIGISNQKLHARGPMGLEELTTYKYIVRGEGQVRR